MIAAFETLKREISILLKMQEEREKIQDEIVKITQEAKEIYHNALDQYTCVSNRIESKLNEAAADNEANKERLAELTKQQIQCELNGRKFALFGEVEKLKTEIATYSEKVEGLKAAAAENHINEVDNNKIVELRLKWQEKEERQRQLETDINSKIALLKNSIINDCGMTTEYIPSRRVFLPEILEKKLSEMQKEV